MAGYDSGPFSTSASMSDAHYSEVIDAEIIAVLRHWSLPEDYFYDSAPGKSLGAKWLQAVEPAVNDVETNTEGTQLTDFELSFDPATVSAQQNGTIASVTDLSAIVSVPDVRANATRSLSAAIAEEQTDTQCAVFAGLSHDNGGARSAFDITKLRAAIADLESRSVPGPYCAVLHTHQWSDLVSDLIGSNNATFLANDAFSFDYEAVGAANVGSLLGVDISLSNGVGTSVADRVGVLMQRGVALGMYRPMPVRVESGRDVPGTVSDFVSVVQAYGVAIRSDDRATKILSTAA